MKRTLFTIPRIWLLLALVFILTACSTGLPVSDTGTQPQATPVIIEPTPVPGSELEDPWQRIQETGRILVGISADYRPFEYYTENFTIDGFDPALMRLIGEKLGVEVQFRDMAFEGLGAALAVNQIDVAISAISVTPEREARFDFSQIYYVSDGAALAHTDFAGTLQSLEDVANYRVGVQKSSIYESLLRRDLVQTGLMPVDNLLVYSNFEQVANDLAEDRIDLIIADQLPIAQLARQDDLEIVLEGINRQYYAVAMRKDSGELLQQINRALAELQGENAIAGLVEQYLAISAEDVVPIPSATPEPTPVPTVATPPTPTPEPPCLDAMAWVADLNLDDANMTAPPVVQPGMRFQKGWRLRNVGTCPWDTGYTLSYVSGNVPAASMGGQPVALQQAVQPEGRVDIYANLVAPLAPGVYQGFWQMRNSQGVPFGDRVWVGIVVPGAPTPTPPPPVASIDFRADRTSINAGEGVNFSWNVENVRAVYFYAEGQPWQENGVGGVDGRTVHPNVSTTYELRVERNDGNTEIARVRIEVSQAVSAPFISAFGAHPSGQITVGQCVSLEWNVQGNVNTVNISRDNTPIWFGAPVQGTFQDCPPGAGTVTYYLDAAGPGGSSRASDAVDVINATVQPPVVPPGPELGISNFNVSPGNIAVGQCVNISWSTFGSTAFVRVIRNGAVVLDNGPTSGNIQDCLGVGGFYMYRLEALDYNQRSQSAEAAVIAN